MKPVTCLRAALILCGLLAADNPVRAQSGAALPRLEAAAPQKSQELADQARNLRQASIEPLATFSEAAGGNASLDRRHERLVTFRHGSAKLTPSATRQLDDFGRALPQATREKLRLRIAGFGDGTGLREADRDLASRRAHTVAAYLEQEAGIAGNQIEIAGLYGHTRKVSISIIEP